MLALVSIAAGFVAGPPASVRLPMSQSRPTMLLDAVPHIDIPSLLLAKDESEEFLDELLISVPVIVTGGALAAFAAEYARTLKPLSTPLPDFVPELPELPELPAVPEQYSGLVTAAVIPGGAVAFVLIAKAGLLGTVAGALAKTALDGWNLFAGVFLKGAYLKYN